MSSRRSTSFWVAALLLAVILVPTTLAAAKGQRTWSTRNSYNDRRAPRPVDALQVAAADKTSVALDWPQTTDNVGVEGYDVYLDGTRKADTPNTEYTFTSLVCSKGYTVAVDAFDDAGNRSRKTSTFVSTAACGDVAPPSAPTGVYSVATTETQVILAWTPSTDDFGVVGYGLYVGGFWVGQWSEPSATITNLSCGQTYQIGIDAMDAAGNNSARTNAFFSTAPCSDHTPPSAPTGLAVSKSSPTGVTLAWAASTDASGIAEYGLYRDGAKVGSATSTTGDFSGLQCGRTYTFGVDAADKEQNRSAVTTLTAAAAPCATGDTTAPTAPPNLTAYSVTQTTVVLRWDSSTDAGGMAGYQIFRDGAKIGEGPGVHGGLTNQWTDGSRTCGTRYSYAVAGVDAAGNVGTKSTLDVTTSACDATTPPPPTTSDTTAPTAPSGVAASTRTATSIALTWQPSTDNVGVTGYGLYRAGSRVATATTTTWIFGGLTCGTNYTLAVDSVDAAGNRSPQAVVMVSTTACSDTQPPTTPTNLQASNVGQTSLDLGWSASTDNIGVTGYDVYRGGTKTTTVTGLSSTQAGLACGTSYTFTVRARDAAGNSSAQAQLIVSTSACSTAPAPPPSSGPETITPSQFSARATSGATISNVIVTGDVNVTRSNVTIQNATIQGGIDFESGSSGGKLLNSSASHVGIWSADNILLEGNTFDGQGKVKDGITMWDDPAGDTPSGWVFRNNTFRNFYVAADQSAHSQAIYVGYSTNGLIEGNTFENNGTTAHIFFTWWGETANSATSYPRNICVRNNTFRDGPDVFHYYDVNFRAEIPSSAGIVIERDATSTSPQFYGSC
jgi:chitodextrinase